MTGDRKAPSLFVREPQLVEKVCFFKKSACSQSLSPNPFPRERGYITGATAPDQARMLAVSHTKPLHDAVAQMADDMYGGYTPATPFLYNQEVYRQSVGPAVIAGLFLFQNIISCIFFLPIHCLLVTS